MNKITMEYQELARLNTLHDFKKHRADDDLKTLEIAKKNAIEAINRNDFKDAMQEIQECITQKAIQYELEKFCMDLKRIIEDIEEDQNANT